MTVLLCLGIGEYSGVLSQGDSIRFVLIELHEFEMNIIFARKQQAHHKIKNPPFATRRKKRIPIQFNTKK